MCLTVSTLVCFLGKNLLMLLASVSSVLTAYSSYGFYICSCGALIISNCPCHNYEFVLKNFQADKEQILSSFLYASVLSHDCLERSLGFVLANRLQNATLLATQLMDIFDDVMMNDRGIQRSIRLDAQVIPLWCDGTI